MFEYIFKMIFVFNMHVNLFKLSNISNKFLWSSQCRYISRWCMPHLCLGRRFLSLIFVLAHAYKPIINFIVTKQLFIPVKHFITSNVLQQFMWSIYVCFSHKTFVTIHNTLRYFHNYHFQKIEFILSMQQLKIDVLF